MSLIERISPLLKSKSKETNDDKKEGTQSLNILDLLDIDFIKDGIIASDKRFTLYMLIPSIEISGYAELNLQALFDKYALVYQLLNNNLSFQELSMNFKFSEVEYIKLLERAMELEQQAEIFELLAQEKNFYLSVKEQYNSIENFNLHVITYESTFDNSVKAFNDAKKILHQCVNAVTGHLKGIGIRPRLLDNDEVYVWLFNAINPFYKDKQPLYTSEHLIPLKMNLEPLEVDNSQLHQADYKQSDETYFMDDSSFDVQKEYNMTNKRLKNILAYSIGSSLNRDYLFIENHYCTFFEVFDYPNEPSTWWLRQLTALRDTIDIVKFVKPADHDRLIKYAQNKQIGIKTSRYDTKKKIEKDEKTALQDYRDDSTLSDVEYIMKAINNGHRFYDFTLVVKVKAKTLDAFEDLINKTESHLKATAVRYRRTTGNLINSFISTLPLGLNKMFSVTPIVDIAVANAFIYNNFSIYYKYGLMVGNNTNNNSLVFINPYLTMNSIIAILGMSGGGKSVLTKKLTEAFRMLYKSRVYAYDPNNEMEPLCKRVLGKYYDLGPDSETKINIMYPFMSNIKGTSISEHISFLEFFVSSIGYTNDDTAIFSGLFNKYYLSKQDIFEVKYSLSDFIEFCQLHQDQGLNLAKLVRYRDVFKLFDTDEPLQLSNKESLFFGTKNIPSSYKKPVSVIILNLITALSCMDNESKVVIFEENHTIISDELLGKMESELIKFIRKFGGIPILNLQNITDYSLTEFGSAIIKNSAIQFIMKQDQEDLEIIQKKYMIPELEAVKMLNFAEGECLMKLNSDLIPIKVQVNPVQLATVSNTSQTRDSIMKMYEGI